MAVNVTRFGPGEFTLGTVPGTDYSCQVESMGLVTNKDEGETVTVLCGDSVPGGISYDWTLEGSVLQDLAVASGLVQFSWDNMGKEVAFSFTPSTEAGTAVSGTVIIDPLNIGASDAAFGDVLTSDFSWSVKGVPVVAWPTPLGV